MADAGKIPLPFQTLFTVGHIFSKQSLMLGFAPKIFFAFQEVLNNHLLKCLG